MQVDADFAVDLLGELVRAYLAATTISYQVRKKKKKQQMIKQTA